MAHTGCRGRRSLDAQFPYQVCVDPGGRPFGMDLGVLSPTNRPRATQITRQPERSRAPASARYPSIPIGRPGYAATSIWNIMPGRPKP